MKAALLRGPGDVILDEVPIPKIRSNEVLVEVKYCGICGSDVHNPDCVFHPAGTYMGHEFSGVLSEVGNEVKGWKVGDRVVVNPMYTCGECDACRHGHESLCNYGVSSIGAPLLIGCVPGKEYAGAFAKYVRVSIPERRLHRLPDELSYGEGALAEPLATALHALRVSAFQVGMRTVVLGVGPIGLGLIMLLKNAGARSIFAVMGRNRKRSEMAKEFGADHVFAFEESPRLKQKVHQLSSGKGVDIVFDCSGALPAFESATDFLVPRGQIVIVGLIPSRASIPPLKWVINEWRLQGSFCYDSDEFPMVLDFMQKNVPQVRKMITSRIRLKDIVNKGLDVLSTPGNKEIKILVEPEE